MMLKSMKSASVFKPSPSLATRKSLISFKVARPSPVVLHADPSGGGGCGSKEVGTVLMHACTKVREQNPADAGL